MSCVKVTTVITCDVSDSESAHQLGQELESRLHSAVKRILPSLHYSSCIRSGDIQFNLEIQGKRIKISVNPTSTEEK